MLSKDFWSKCTKEKTEASKTRMNTTFWQHGGERLKTLFSEQNFRLSKIKITSIFFKI